jgi:hypothetical protein
VALRFLAALPYREFTVARHRNPLLKPYAQMMDPFALLGRNKNTIILQILHGIIINFSYSK